MLRSRCRAQLLAHPLRMLVLRSHFAGAEEADSRFDCLDGCCKPWLPIEFISCSLGVRKKDGRISGPTRQIRDGYGPSRRLGDSADKLQDRSSGAGRKIECRAFTSDL